MAKYTYTLQFHSDEKWVTLPGFHNATLRYLQGFCEGRRDAEGLRPAYRILRGDGKVMEEVQERTALPLGMIAGFPTPEQYETAGFKALATAHAMRTREKERKPSEDDRARVRVLASPPVLDALAPEHREPRYMGNECSDDNPRNRLSFNQKEHSCLRCVILLAKEAVEEADIGFSTDYDFWIEKRFQVREG